MFIRTKDNIFEVVEETDLVYRVKAKTIPNKVYSKSKCQTSVIKQADTIEELCDEFVVIDKIDKRNYIVNPLQITEKEISIFLMDGAIIYGAIWTDKGLIYVAKMNDKGELELL